MIEPIPGSTLQIISLVEYGLWAVGAVILLRFLFGDASRVRREAPSPLQPWSITIVHFFRMALCVIVGGWIVPVIVVQLGNHLPASVTPTGNLWIMVQGLAFQLGLLAGVVAALLLPRDLDESPALVFPDARPLSSRPFLDAIGTLLVALPVITLLGFVWKRCLSRLGIETPDQEMVDVFRNAGSPSELTLLITLAVVVAPLTEELIFRAGLFRYLRTRLPYWVALLAPAAIFAALHTNAVAFLPLFALGILFSLAYERTGRISVTIIAHGLFNLHTILLIMAGVTS